MYSILTIVETELFSKRVTDYWTVDERLDFATLAKKELTERDARRDIGEELLRSVRQMRARKTGRVHEIDAPRIAAIRVKTGMSQSEFAEILGISVRTLQDWEQGRRSPTKAAKTLLRIADQRPEVLREVAA